MFAYRPVRHGWLPSAALNRPRKIFLAFLVATFLLGGGSRPDINSLALLRLLSFVAMGWAVLQIERDDIARIKIPLAILGAIATTALVQLVPLPPTIWGALPGRAPIAELDALMGFDIWRPLSLSPSATANALFSLGVPLAAILLFAVARDADLALAGFVGIGFLSAILGIVQLFGDPNGPLYFYEITNNGSAVGLFANRNHQAVFLGCCLLICIYLAKANRFADTPIRKGLLWLGAITLATGILINGSRAGLIVLALTAALAVAILVGGLRKTDPSRPNPGFSWPVRIALAIMALGLLGLFVISDRVPAIERLLERDPLEDLRALILPILIKMVRDFLPWGAGLGAFEYAFRMREPLEFLGPQYVNEAHNDWLQFVIEGGVMAIAILLSTMMAVLWRLVRLIKRTMVDDAKEPRAWLGLGLILILSLSSAVDYPLRVPSLMVLGIIALAVFFQPGLNGASKNQTGSITRRN